jgi:hypothetical protein
VVLVDQQLAQRGLDLGRRGVARAPDPLEPGDLAGVLERV